jgi:pentose-5-phosphate-3-epimerase
MVKVYLMNFETGEIKKDTVHTFHKSFMFKTKKQAIKRFKQAAPYNIKIHEARIKDNKKCIRRLKKALAKYG